MLAGLGDFPVFAGESLRPQWPPSGAYARAVLLLLRNPWRQASDLRDDSSETWAAEFTLFLAQEELPHMAPKFNVERAKAVSRARGRVWGAQQRPRSPTQRTMTRRTHSYTPLRDADAADVGPGISDFQDYGDSIDWPSVSGEVEEAGFPGPYASATWLPTRVAQVRATGSCEGFLPRPGGAGAGINTYDANPGQRFQIALVLQIIHEWVNGSADHRQLRLLTAGVSGAGKSFFPHALTDLVRKLLGFEGAAKVFAPTGVAAFQVGGPTGHRLLRVPTGKKAPGQLEPLKGDALREAQDNLRHCALLVGDERGVIGRSTMC